MKVITYQDTRGNQVNLTEAQVDAFAQLGAWPKNAFGEEYCQVKHGLHVGRATPLVIVETMPEHLRESHRAARNWGEYPLNGAERSICERDEAERLVAEDPDGYTSIVEDFGLV